MSTPAPPSRLPGVDALKLILALMVVGIHANPFGILGRPAALVTGEGLYRLGVPIFLIFNGYFLQGAIAKGRGWAYVKRAATLYVIWMALYLPVYWSMWMNQNAWQHLRTILFGYWHLWYVSALVMAAAVAVALRAASTRTLALVAGAAFAGGMVMLYGMALGLWKPDPNIFRDPLPPVRNALFVGLPFLLMGVIIRREGLEGRWPRATILRLAALSVALVLVESFAAAYLSPRPQSHDLMLNLGLAAPLLAIAALQWPANFNAGSMGAYSSGIYFIHVFVVAWAFRATEMKTWGAGSLPIWVLAVVVSVAATWAIRRTRADRWLL